MTATDTPTTGESFSPPPDPNEVRLTINGRPVVARKGDLERADKLLAENHKWNPNWAPTRTAELAVAQMHRERVQAASK